MYVGHSLTISANGSISFLDDTGNWIEPEEGRIVVMQYTSLKDKNGKEIYEGDVIDAPVHCGKAEVVYDQPYNASFCVGNGLLGVIDYSDIEVVGNVYENPELLNRK